MKKKIAFAVQALVTIGLLIWIFSNEEVRQNTSTVLREARPEWLLAAIVVAGLENLIGVFRWRIFLKILNVDLPFWQTVRIFFLGLFCNTFLIGSVGGDAIKVLILIGKGHRRGPCLLSVVLDRMSGLAGMVVASFVFILWHYHWLTESPIVSALIHFVFLYLFVLVGLLVLSLVASGTGFTSRLPARMPFRVKLIELCELYYLFVSEWRKTLVAAGLSVVLLLGYFTIFYCSMRAFGIELPLTKVYSLMPVVDIITALPISLGGVGVREKLFVILLGQLAGVPPAAAVWVGITGFSATLFWGLVGLMAFPFFRDVLKKGREVEAARQTS